MLDITAPSSPEASLVVTDLHKSFGALEVLTDVSLRACQGDVISLLGSSGLGKSTFLHRINLLETPNSGPMHVLKKSHAEATEKAQEVLERVGMYERRDCYPAHLSGGQQQRAAIARALAMEPEVLLFDQPTSALDPKLVDEVLKVIRSLAEEGRTIVVVAHEMAFARDVSSQVVFLHQGLIEEQGQPDQMFNDPQSTRFKEFLSKIGDQTGRPFN